VTYRCAATIAIAGLLGGCTDAPDDDGPTIHGPPGCPAILAPGVHGPRAGVGDTMSICVVDSDTGQPVEGAAVRLDGIRTGLTAADGRVDFPGGAARAVTVGEPGGSQVTWAGFQGTQWISPYERDVNVPARVTGRIAGWAALPAPAAGHYLLADVTYTRRTDPTYRKNTLEQDVVDGMPQNRCRRDPGPGAACDWALTTRPGRQRIIATIIDADDAGTTTTDDDVYEVVGYADSGSIILDSGEQRADVVLELVPADELWITNVDVTDYSEAPKERRGELSLDLGEDGELVGAFPPLVAGAAPRLYPVNGGRFAGRYDLFLYAYEPGEDATYALTYVVGVQGGGYNVHGDPMRISRCGPSCWRLTPAWTVAFATFRRDDGTSWSVFQSDYSAGRIMEPTGLDLLGETPVRLDVRSFSLERLDIADFELLDIVTDPSSSYAWRYGAGASGIFTP
jgi:hypothetical protein